MKTSFPGMTVSLAPTWPIAGNPENPMVHDSLRANGGPQRAARIAYSEITATLVCPGNVQRPRTGERRHGPRMRRRTVSGLLPHSPTIREQLNSDRVAPVAGHSARGETASLLFKFGPARVKGIQISLRRFHRCLGSNEPGCVARNRRVFELSPFTSQHLLSLANALFNAGVFPCFQVRELLLSLHRRLGETRNNWCRGPCLVRCPIAFLLPGFPLRIAGEARSVSLTIQAQHHGRHAIKQIAVMRDEDERAAKFEQALFENFQSGNVEVVGWLIQQENVGGLQHELSDQHTSPFASGKSLNWLAELFTREQEFRSPRCDVNDAILVNDCVAFRSQCF